MKTSLFILLVICCSCVCQRRPSKQSQLDTTAQTNNTESSCDGRPLDLIFVIDSSRSVRADDFERVKSFIRDVLLFLDVARDQTRVGLVQFGSVVQNEFFLNSYFEKRQMERAVRSMEHLASGTMTGLALQFTREQAFSLARGARPAHTQVPRIAVVVTDDRPQDSVEEEAARAREDGIEIFAVGVGRVDMATLRAACGTCASRFCLPLKAVCSYRWPIDDGEWSRWKMETLENGDAGEWRHSHRDWKHTRRLVDVGDRSAVSVTTV